MQRADAEVKAVQHRVAGEQHADEDEPSGVEIEIHNLKRKRRVVNDEFLNSMSKGMTNDEILMTK